MAPTMFPNLSMLTLHTMPISAPKRKAGEMGKKRNATGDAVFADHWTVNALGAHVGASIRGIRRADTGLRSGITDPTYDSVNGVVLLVVEGAMLPLQTVRQFARDVYDKPGQPGWASKVAAKFAISPPQAQQLIDQFEPYAASQKGLLGWTAARPFSGAPQQVAGQAPLKVRILAAGAWSHSQQILDWIADGTAVTTGEIGIELDRAQKEDPSRPGFLALRPHLWVQAPSSGRVEAREGDQVYVNAAQILAGPEEAEHHYDVEDHTGAFRRVVVPPSATELSMQDVPGLVKEELAHLMSDVCKYRVQDPQGRVMMTSMFGELTETEAQADVDAVFEVLRGENVRFGALKSGFQKLSRIQADRVKLPNGRVVDGRIAVMVMLAITFTSRGGGFIPDLGLYVRGQVAALKRLGVTMVEDAWPERPMLKGLPGVAAAQRDPGTVLAALLGTALVCVRVTDYYAPRSVIKSALHIVAASLHSSQVLAWRPGLQNTEVAGRAIKIQMQRAAVLLRTLVSFRSDMDMFDQVAQMATEEGMILVKENPEDVAGNVPLRHLIDQHFQRGFADALLSFPTLAGFPSPEDTIAKRFKLTFNRVTGFSPRLAGHLIDEGAAIVKAVRFAQAIVQINVFPGLHTTRWGGPGLAPEQVQQVTTQVYLDYGVMSAGVGPIGPVRFKTTAQQNEDDGFFPGGERAGQNWSLLVILPVEKEDEIVINFVSAHAGDNAKKPAPTATAKREAIRLARLKSPYKFSSPMMPLYTRVEHVADGQYKVMGTFVEPVTWTFDSVNSISVAYTEVNSAEETPAALDLTDDNQVLTWVKEKLPPGMENTMLRGWQQSLRQVLTNLPAGVDHRKMLLRMLSLLKQQYVEVAMPTPGLKGEMGSDQMKVQQGDWIVWRMLLAVSRLCPGALVPKQIPVFKVQDARLLRLVEKELVAMVEEAAAVTGPSKQHWIRVVNQMQAHWQIPGNKKPFNYQTALINTMMQRDRLGVVGTQGNFVSLETGAGKTLVGLNYAVRHAAARDGIDKIIWVTPMAVIETFVQEARASWDTAVSVVNRANPVMRRNTINVVGLEWFSPGGSRGPLETEFLDAAESAFIVFDEVHMMYSAAIRNSTMREAALLCAKFVCMTATPIGSSSQAYALDWLKDTVGFPVSRENQLVASAMMAAARVELPTSAKEALVEFEMPPDLLQRHTQLLQSGRNWSDAFELCMDASAAQLVQAAVAEATRDRAINPTGGCLLVLDSQARLNAARTAIEAGFGDHGLRAAERTIANAEDPNLAIILATKGDVTGYNLVRVGALVTGVYPSSAAKRHQMRGRIRRVGQTRAEVRYVTVVPKFTIMELLHRRHNSVDRANESLAQLAEEFVKGL